MGLYDAIMIKDTHIDLIGGMVLALQALPETMVQQIPVIVEVRTVAELQIVLQQGLHKVTRVLLDNMSPALLNDCVALCKGKIATEASGNIDLTNVAAIAESGVDFVSSGKLTHSAGNVDLSMQAQT
jgi:nicotinate-nucleotide pyrophosphorylase (carboxylating)